MKIWKIAVVITLAVALVLGVALPGLADSSEPATIDKAWGKWFPRIIKGEVIDTGDSLFVVQSGEQEPTIYVTDDTRYFIVSAPERVLNQLRTHAELKIAESPVPAQLKPQFGLSQLRKGKTDKEPALFTPQRTECAQNLLQLHNGQGIAQGIRARLLRLCHLGEEATFGDLEIGDKVVVLLAPPMIDALTTEAEEKLTARVVLIIEPSVWERIAGTIKRLSDDAIVIEPVGGGDAVPLRYDESTTFILKGFTSVEVEQFARVLYNTETTIAKVVRVWPEAPQLLQPAE